MKENYKSKNFDHLGIVAVICKEIGLQETVDQLIPSDPQMAMTLGECLKLMTLNGLGFTSRPLYLEAQFFASRPLGRLLGRDCGTAINDDRLGRALDRFYDFGCDRLFAALAAKAAIRYGISQKFRHLDSTSMNVHGQYESEEDKPLITFGYSKDQRSDLKQFMIYLMNSQDGDVPLLAQTVAGNSSDKKLFRENLQALKKEIQQGKEGYFIADSALYTKETIQEISSHLKWITRVPESNKEAKTLLQTPLEMVAVEEGYSAVEITSQYGDIPQRWLVVDSVKARDKKEKTLQKRIQKEYDTQLKEGKKLQREIFSCRQDAKRALESYLKKLRYHKLQDIEIVEKRCKKGKGRPKLEDTVQLSYVVQVNLVEDKEKIEKKKAFLGRFIIATNELTEEKLSSRELLGNYKEQQCGTVGN